MIWVYQPIPNIEIDYSCRYVPLVLEWAHKTPHTYLLSACDMQWKFATICGNFL